MSLIDALDDRLLRALALCASSEGTEEDLRIPLRRGARSAEDAQAEIAAARRHA